MQPPINVKTFEGDLATFWFDTNGILCALGKNTPRSLQKQKENYQFIKQITGGKKVCLLSSTTNSKPHDKETRDYIESELVNHFKAMAIISRSAVGELIPKIFMTINQQSIPIQYFDSETEARQWLQQYL